ncbi:MAG: hypothetical protein PHQ64_01425, partial [Bacilli bacterium]|nr:hypothetical protein [Bacilli bacterium]
VDAITAKGVAANVSEDLSSLASKISAISSGKKIILLGNATTYDLKTNYATYGLDADDYKNLTVDDFIIEVTAGAQGTINNGNLGDNTTVYGRLDYSKTYDSTTGIISLWLSAHGAGQYYATVVQVNTPVPHKILLVTE